jgi:hypothetical protein
LRFRANPAPQHFLTPKAALSRYTNGFPQH